jgi:tRNA threonylcarbamoyladenosine biosynthesis protein TsaE
VNERAPFTTTVVTYEPESTRALAGALSEVARHGDLVSLVGDLGAGKTQFAKGFGAGLGVSDTIVSPTFVLMAEYRGRLPLFHIDLYRLADAAEAMAGGLIDDRQSEGVTLIEWAERLSDAMPAGRLDVLIDGTGDDPRTITLIAETAEYARYVDAAARFSRRPRAAGTRPVEEAAS